MCGNLDYRDTDVEGRRTSMRQINQYVRTKRARRESLIGWGFLLPSFIGVLVFVLIPFADAVRRSFSETMTRKFVGLANY